MKRFTLEHVLMFELGNGLARAMGETDCPFWLFLVAWILQMAVIIYICAWLFQSPSEMEA
jgi:hypothetical protein